MTGTAFALPVTREPLTRTRLQAAAVVRLVKRMPTVAATASQATGSATRLSAWKHHDLQDEMTAAAVADPL